MEKVNVVILSDDIDLRIEIKNLLDTDRYAISGFAGFGEEAKTKVISLYPEIVLCAVRDKASDGMFDFVQNLLATVHAQNTMVVLASDFFSADYVNTSAQHGIRKVIKIEGMTTETFSDELWNVFELEQQRVLDTNEGKKVRSKVLSFFSGKGGTGKTTLAINTAVSIAQMGKRVMLIDLDLQFGDVAISLDFDAKYSIVDLVQDRGGITIENINNFVVEHSSGMSVLCAPKSSEFAEYVTPAHVEKIIDTMRPYYEYIVIDMATDFNDVVITACENSDELYLVYHCDILSLRNARVCYDILDQLHQKDKMNIVLNKAEKGLIKSSDFKKMFDMDVAFVLPSDDKSAILCVNKGQPIVLAKPRSVLSEAIKKMAEKIVSGHSSMSLISSKGEKKVKAAKKKIK